LPFIRLQLELGNKMDFIEELEDWMKLTRRITRDSGMQFLPRINMKFSKPIRDLVKHIVSNPQDKTWHDSVIEIWQNRGNWERLFVAPEEE